MYLAIVPVMPFLVGLFLDDSIPNAEEGKIVAVVFWPLFLLIGFFFLSHDWGVKLAKHVNKKKQEKKEQKEQEQNQPKQQQIFSHPSTDEHGCVSSLSEPKTKTKKKKKKSKPQPPTMGSEERLIDLS